MILFYWIVFSFIVAVLADKWHHSGSKYFFISLLLSPLVGILFLLFSGKNSDALEKEQIYNNQLIKCPFCKELVKPDAVKCKHCGSDISSHTQSLETKLTKLTKHEEISPDEKKRLSSLNKNAWIVIGVIVALVFLMDAYLKS